MLGKEVEEENDDDDDNVVGHGEVDGVDSSATDGA